MFHEVETARFIIAQVNLFSKCCCSVQKLNPSSKKKIVYPKVPITTFQGYVFMQNEANQCLWQKVGHRNYVREVDWKIV